MDGARIPTTDYWTPQELIAIYRGLLDSGWAGRHVMSSDQAERFATKLAHFGRVALMDREVQREGWAAIRSGFHPVEVRR